MAKKKTLRIEGRAHPHGDYWVVIVSGKVVSGAKRQLPFYELALAFAEGYTGMPGLTDEYRRTGKAKYRFTFEPLTALKSLLRSLDDLDSDTAPRAASPCLI